MVQFLNRKAKAIKDFETISIRTGNIPYQVPHVRTFARSHSLNFGYSTPDCFGDGFDVCCYFVLLVNSTTDWFLGGIFKSCFSDMSIVDPR